MPPDARPRIASGMRDRSHALLVGMSRPSPAPMTASASVSSGRVSPVEMNT